MMRIFYKAYSYRLGVMTISSAEYTINSLTFYDSNHEELGNILVSTAKANTILSSLAHDGYADIREFPFNKR